MIRPWFWFLFPRKMLREVLEARAQTQALYDALRADLEQATVRADATLDRLKAKHREAQPAVRLTVIK